MCRACTATLAASDARASTASPTAGRPVPIVEPRFRYNQDFKSIYAMVPAVIMLLLMLIPAMLTALSVVREKELGSIANFYATPVTRLEFLLGKQLPYIAIAHAQFPARWSLLAVFLFRVPIKGSFLTLLAGALLYVGEHRLRPADLGLRAHPDRRDLRHGDPHHAAGPHSSPACSPGLLARRARRADRRSLPHHLLPG